MNWVEMISEAENRIYGLVKETPLELVKNDSTFSRAARLFMKQTAPGSGLLQTSRSDQ